MWSSIEQTPISLEICLLSTQYVLQTYLQIGKIGGRVNIRSYDLNIVIRIFNTMALFEILAFK